MSTTRTSPAPAHTSRRVREEILKKPTIKAGLTFLIIASDGNSNGFTTSPHKHPQRHPLKVSGTCFLGIRIRLDRPASTAISLSNGGGNMCFNDTWACRRVNLSAALFTTRGFEIFISLQTLVSKLLSHNFDEHSRYQIDIGSL